MNARVKRQLERLYESDPASRESITAHPTLYRRVTAVLDASEALGDYLVANRGEWEALWPDASRGLDEVRAASEAASLRRQHRRRLLQISADDLTGDGDIAHVTAELSALADACLDAGLSMGRAEHPGADTSLAIVAMGKAGGRELNYVSDVDVLFVAEGDLELATRQAARVATVNGMVAWEIDPGLRPEGRNGALVRTVDSYVNYYRRWAHTWEFQALMKARPAAGDSALGQAWERAVAPMVWDTADAAAVVNDIRAMRRRVLAELPAGAERELKLGPGGLRDIEFAVQLLQLVHGRSDTSLRSSSTLDALAALTAGGYLGREDGEALNETYRFLRTVEHRLQLQKLRRTHTIPDDPQALHWLARTLGFQDAESFWRRWRKHAVTARRLHEKLFYRPLLEAVAEVPSRGLRLRPDEARARLEVLGFADPAGALRHISALTAGVSRTAAIQRTLLPVLLGEFADSAEPDRGLLSYRQVSEKLGRTPWYLRLLRDGGPIALRLAKLLGTSRYITDLLMRDPAALRLLADDADLVPRDTESMLAGMSAAAARHDDAESAVAAIRAIRRRELLRIACADLLGMLDVATVGRALSDLTDAVLRVTFGIATGEQQFDGRLAVIGMGSLGGRECSYSSDADVLFVHGGDDTRQLRTATAVIERVRALLGAAAAEPPLAVDANLRPEGRQGPIVRSLAAYQRYYERWSRPWEAQALLRARYVAGHGDLAGEFLALADTVRYPSQGLTESQLVELRRIKARVESERLPRGADRGTHVKLGPGGLIDVEWSVQLPQLRHGHDFPHLHTTSTLEALDGLVAVGLLSATDTEVLRQAWREASAIRNALMLVRGTASDQLPRHGPQLVALMSAMRVADATEPGEFVDGYLRSARHAHTVASRIFYGQESMPNRFA